MVSFSLAASLEGQEDKDEAKERGCSVQFLLPLVAFQLSLGDLGIAAFSVHSPRLTLVASVAILRLHPRASGPIGKHLGHSSNDRKAEQRASIRTGPESGIQY